MPTRSSRARDAAAQATVATSTDRANKESTFYHRANESLQPEADFVTAQPTQNNQPPGSAKAYSSTGKPGTASGSGASQSSRLTRRAKRQRPKPDLGTEGYDEPGSKPKRLRVPEKPVTVDPSPSRSGEQGADGIYNRVYDGPDDADQQDARAEDGDQVDNQSLEAAEETDPGYEDLVSFNVLAGTLILAEVPHESLKMLFSRIDGWTYSSEGWDPALTPRSTEKKVAWFQRQSPRLNLKITRSIYSRLYDLIRLFRRVPKEFEAQSQFLVEKQGHFREAVNKINASIRSLRFSLASSYGRGQMPGDWCREPRTQVKEAVKYIIPLLAVTVREAAVLSGGIHQASENWTYANGEFTITMVQLVKLTASWTRQVILTTQRLLETEHLIFTSQRESLAQDSMAKTEVGVLGRHLERMGEFLRAYKSAVNEAGARIQYEAGADARNAASKSRDDQIRAARAEKERRRLEKLGQQNLLFIQSTQAKRSVRDWEQEDDKTLLRIMRLIKRPHIGGLPERVTSGRTLEEVQERIAFLRRESRQYFIAKQLEPPTWCHEQ